MVKNDLVFNIRFVRRWHHETGFVFNMMAARIELWQIIALVKHKSKNFSIYFFWPPKNVASCPRLWLHAAVSAAKNNPSRRRMTVYYSGRVQGVGFRYTAKKVATGFDILGTIRNLPDGRVELIAEGLHSELEEFRLAIRDAGLAGFIQDERIGWAGAQNGFRNFEITGS
jgi:acylphosphatase